MKAVIITLALAGLASTAPVDAQILGTRLPTPATNTSARIDGSWRVVGQDGNGNTIYERRTTDRNGNIIVQRARRDAYGNMSIISSNTIGNTGNRGNNCAYSQSTNTVGDIIFGRTNTNVNCDDVGNRVDGGWYQVGRGRDNNSIYERRIRDSNGNLVIQRARRNPNGTFTILSTRRTDDNDKEWRKAQKRQEREMRKAEREQDRQWKRSRGDDGDDGDNDDNFDRANNDNDDDNGNRGNRPVVLRGDDRSGVVGIAVGRDNEHGNNSGRGNGHGKGKHKEKD